MHAMSFFSLSLILNLKLFYQRKARQGHLCVIRPKSLSQSVSRSVSQIDDIFILIVGGSSRDDSSNSCDQLYL